MELHCLLFIYTVYYTVYYKGHVLGVWQDVSWIVSPSILVKHVLVSIFLSFGYAYSKKYATLLTHFLFVFFFSLLFLFLYLTFSYGAPMFVIEPGDVDYNIYHVFIHLIYSNQAKRKQERELVTKKD